jgi:hypothetical protein
MSRGPGKRERAIEKAFRANPDKSFNIEELAHIAFPAVAHISPHDRWNTVRAANKVADRQGWVFVEGRWTRLDPDIPL